MANENERVFAAPVMHGARFQSGALPLDVLQELEAYQRLIVEVAKSIFLAEHPTRQRVPRGFEGQLNLRLRVIESGSAMPVLLRAERESPQSTLLPQGADEFDQARDLIAETISALAAGHEIPSSFPRSVLPRFNSFGRTLLPAETIELRSNRDDPGPHYNRELRKRLVLSAQESFLDTVDLVGAVTAADIDRHTFSLRLETGRRIDGPLRAEHEQRLLTALKDHESIFVRLVGTGSFDEQDTLKHIDYLDDVVVVEQASVESDVLADRIAELKLLRSGWLDGESGDPLPEDCLDWVGELFLDLYENEGIELPYLYPTPDGNVIAEWSIGGWELSASIDLTTRRALLDAVHTGSGIDKDEQADMGAKNGRLALARFIASFRPRSTR